MKKKIQRLFFSICCAFSIGAAINNNSKWIFFSFGFILLFFMFREIQNKEKRY